MLRFKDEEDWHIVLDYLRDNTTKFHINWISYGWKPNYGYFIEIKG